MKSFKKHAFRLVSIIINIVNTKLVSMAIIFIVMVIPVGR